MIIPAYVARNARKFPNYEAVIDTGVRSTWLELDAHVNACAEILAHDYHIGQGDRVCLVLPNNYAFVVAHFAIQRLGAIVVPVNVKLTPAELGYIFDNAEAK